MNLNQLQSVLEANDASNGTNGVRYNPANAKLKKLAKTISDDLTFNAGGIKAKLEVYAFDLPAGWSCPQAKDCQSRMTPKENGKWGIVDGPATVFRCYAASAEQYPNVRNGRHRNMAAIRKTMKAAVGNGLDPVEAVADLLEQSIPDNAKVIRIHTSGDFFHRDYFRAWLEVARRQPNRVFYAYTKALKLWVDNIENVNSLGNFRLTASRGGTLDHMITEHSLPESVVVFSEAEADKKGIPVDEDDSHAYRQNGSTSFALVIHGTQPKGSEASRAWQAIRSAKMESKK